jgi:parvulin-like peptidyl-prolyl isomerase
MKTIIKDDSLENAGGAPQDADGSRLAEWGGQRPARRTARGLQLVRIMASAATALALLMVSCGHQPQSDAAMPSEAIAVVGDQVITRQAFNEYAGRQGARASKATSRDDLLRELIERQAAVAKAKAAGLDKRADIQAELDRLVAARFKEEQLAKDSDRSPTAAEIEAYYQSHSARFTTPERVHGAVIFLPLSGKAAADKAREVEAKAEQIRGEATKETAVERGFGLLAQRYSEDQASRYRGGDLGYLTAKELDLRLENEAARALLALGAPGEVSPVVKGTRGLYVLKLIARQPETRRPMADVKEGIAYLLKQSKRAEAERAFYAGCTNGLAIRINRSLLENLPLGQEPEIPPAVPGTETAMAK